MRRIQGCVVCSGKKLTDLDLLLTMASIFRCRQINLGHCRFAACQLLADITSFCLDFVFVQEPYVFQNRVSGLSSHLNIVSSAVSPRSCIIVNNNIPFSIVFCNNCINAIFCNIVETLFVNVYIPPNNDQLFEDILTELSHILRLNNWGNIVLLGDFNAKHPFWNNDLVDQRGSQLLDFLNQSAFEILNTPDSLPTFSSSRGRSWIDLSCFKSDMGKISISDWEVSDLPNGTEHNNINFTIRVQDSGIQSSLDTNSGSGFRKFSFKNISKDRRDSPALRFFDSFYGYSVDLQEEIEQQERSTAQEVANSAVSSFDSLVSGSFGPQNWTSKRNLVRRVPWWTVELSIARKRVRALRRRFQRTYNDPGLRDLQKQIYLRELAIYKRSLMRSKRSSWRKFLENITAFTPFRSYSALIKDVSIAAFSTPFSSNLFSVRDNVKLLLDFHFPFVQEEFDYSELDIAPLRVDKSDLITFTEFKYTLRTFKPNKAPGPDGICFDIIRDAFRMNPDFFLDVCNFCLTNGVIPDSWKSARVVFLPKAGRDPADFSAYRPIC